LKLRSVGLLLESEWKCSLDGPDTHLETLNCESREIKRGFGHMVPSQEYRRPR